MNEKTLACSALILTFLGITVHAEFTCTERGPYADPDSDDCRSFVFCNNNRAARSQACPQGTYFSPELKGCFSSYDCATKSMPYNTNPCEGFKYDRIPDKLSTDCSNYFYCQETDVYNDGELVELPLVRTEVCAAGTVFSPRSRCDSNNKCSHYDCIEEGQFEDHSGNDCSTFVRCSKYTNSEYGGSLLYPEIMSCPENTKFNPVLQLCDSFYNCNGIDFHGGIDPCRSFNCSFISNPYVDDSSSYIDCVYYDNVVKAHKRIILREYCPDDTLFSPLLRQCYHNYDPNETCSKDACSTGPGKYVNYKSLNCESYIVCRNEGQTLSLYEPYYEIRYCPEGTRYNPETRKCSRKYVCPTPEENYCYPQISKATPQLATGPTEALLQRYRRLKMCRKS